MSAIDNDWVPCQLLTSIADTSASVRGIAWEVIEKRFPVLAELQGVLAQYRRSVPDDWSANIVFALNSPDAEKAREAARIVAHTSIGTKPIIDALIESATTGPRHIRFMAVWAIGRAKPIPMPIRIAIGNLARRKSSVLIRAALLALRYLDPQSSQAMSMLMMGFDHPSESMRNNISDSIVAMATRLPLKPVRAAIESIDERTQIAALTCLESILSWPPLLVRTMSRELPNASDSYGPYLAKRLDKLISYFQTAKDTLESAIEGENQSTSTKSWDLLQRYRHHFRDDDVLARLLHSEDLDNQIFLAEQNHPDDDLIEGETEHTESAEPTYPRHFDDDSDHELSPADLVELIRTAAEAVSAGGSQMELHRELQRALSIAALKSGFGPRIESPAMSSKRLGRVGRFVD